MATTIEVERKYRLPRNFALPDLTTIAGVARLDEPAKHELDATYYDTTDLRLIRRQITLRRRTGGHDAGWHLKRPADAERSEQREPLGGKTDEVPDALRAQVRAVSRTQPLRPVARIRTRRVERPLLAPDGTVLALVADDTVTGDTLVDPMGTQRWRELEVEIVGGPRGLLDAALRHAGARPSGDRSKLARTLRAKQGTAAAGGTGKGGRALTRYLAGQRDAILRTDPGVRAGDPDAVHDMRVATRRLRATLRTFRRVLEGDGLLVRDELRRLGDELRWLGTALGAVRDGDVMGRRLDGVVAAQAPESVVGPVRARIRERLATQTRQARDELAGVLDSDRYDRLLDGLDALVEATASVRFTGARLRRQAGKAVRRADRRLVAADRVRPGREGSVPLPPPPADNRDVALHEARKAYKRARYAAEALVPLEGRPAHRLAKRLTALQDSLGAHQDAIVTGQLLRDYGMRAYLDGENAFTYGLLHAGQQEAAARAIADLARIRRRAGRAKVRRWLG